MNTFKHFGAAALAISALTATLIPAQANAGDKKLIPATVCQPWGTDTQYSNYLQYSQFGRLINTHTTKRLGVVCPIPRDETNGAPSHFRIYIHDGSQSNSGDKGKVKCTLYSTKSYGNSWVDWQVIQTGAIQTGSMALTFHNIDNTWNGGSGNESGFAALCLLPPKWGNVYSYLGSIAVIEGSGTGND